MPLSSHSLLVGKRATKRSGLPQRMSLSPDSHSNWVRGAWRPASASCVSSCSGSIGMTIVSNTVFSGNSLMFLDDSPELSPSEIFQFLHISFFSLSPSLCFNLELRGKIGQWCLPCFTYICLVSYAWAEPCSRNVSSAVQSSPVRSSREATHSSRSPGTVPTT